MCGSSRKCEVPLGNIFVGVVQGLQVGLGLFWLALASWTTLIGDMWQLVSPEVELIIGEHCRFDTFLQSSLLSGCKFESVGSSGNGQALPCCCMSTRYRRWLSSLSSYVSYEP
jgi:hypothetical protein